jgi:SAM-dependent methyltransferase
LGFDLSWSRCAGARARLREESVSADVFVGDLFAIPLADASVDVVYNSHSLEPNGGREREALCELLRVTRHRLVLCECLYELAPEPAQARMRGNGYVRVLEDTLRSLGADVKACRLLPYSYACGEPFNYPQVPDVKNPENFEKLIYDRFNLL